MRLLHLPTQESAKIALQNAANCSPRKWGLLKTADPMAGSHYLEELCDQIEDGVWKYLKKNTKNGRICQSY